MGDINEYLEEVYQDADLRKEFQKFVELRSVHKAILQDLYQQMSAQYPSLLSYTVITSAIYREEFETWKVKGLKEGLYFLSRSLGKTVAQRYHLTLFDARELVALVADKYEQEPQGSVSMSG